MSTIGALDSFYLPVVVFAFCTAFFLFLLWAMLRRPSNRVTAFEDGNGSVSVSRRALEEIIARSCEQFDEIVRAKVSIHTRKNRIRTEIQIQLKQSARVRDFSKQLRARITDVLTNNLGMEDVGTMELIVGGIVPDENSPKTTDLDHEIPPAEKKDE
jgi:hypothetical protein